MTTNTKTLFAALLKELQADCVAATSSCADGDQSLSFGILLPKARVFALSESVHVQKIWKRIHASNVRTSKSFPSPSPIKKRSRFSHHRCGLRESRENADELSSLRDNVKIKEPSSRSPAHRPIFCRRNFQAPRAVCFWIDAEGADIVFSKARPASARTYAVHWKQRRAR